MEKKLPLYQIMIDENPASDVEVDFVALVDMPAIEKNFIAFDKVKPLHFEVVSEDRRIISGPAMLADTPIYRRDEVNGEYNVVFSPQTVYEIAQKFFQKGFNQNFNLMHDPAMKVPDVCIFESFIVDKTRGIAPMKGFEDAPEGSWFISAKVNNDQVWQFIKEGKVKGFSIEGIFNLKIPKAPELSRDEKLQSLIDFIKNL